MNDPDRRRILRGLGLGVAGLLAAPRVLFGASAAPAPTRAPAVLRGRHRIGRAPGTEYSAKTIEIVESALVIDMLGLLSLDFPKLQKWMLDPALYPDSQHEKVRLSHIDVLHPAIGIAGPRVRERCRTFFESWNAFIAAHDGRFFRVDDVKGLDRARDPARVGVLLGVQNSEHFEKVGDVDIFHALGQRVSQLTYNSPTRIGTGATAEKDEGLTEYGLEVVARMNEVGMAVDVSHCGDRTTLDAFESSRRPVLITHSNCRAVQGGDHPRCKSDAAIEAMAESGGVMGITGVRMFVRSEEPTTIEHLLDHYDHVRDLVGPEHLGIGSDIDLDGYDDMPPAQLQALKSGYKDSYAFRDKIDIDAVAHPRRTYDLVEGLGRRGYSRKQIEGILGGNFRRALGEIWKRGE